jgi:plasmid stabilization system protein ParE
MCSRVPATPGAAARREREIAALVASIAANPHSGARLGGRLRGWLVRHGGRGRMVTVVFRPADEAGAVLIAMVAFAGLDGGDGRPPGLRRLTRFPSCIGAAMRLYAPHQRRVV